MHSPAKNARTKQVAVRAIDHQRLHRLVGQLNDAAGLSLHTLQSVVKLLLDSYHADLSKNDASC